MAQTIQAFFREHGQVGVDIHLAAKTFKATFFIAGQVVAEGSGSTPDTAVRKAMVDFKKTLRRNLREHGQW